MGRSATKKIRILLITFIIVITMHGFMKVKGFYIFEFLEKKGAGNKVETFMYIKPILVDKNLHVPSYDCVYKNTLAGRHNNDNTHFLKFPL